MEEILETYGKRRSKKSVFIFTIAFIPLIIYEWVEIYNRKQDGNKWTREEWGSYIISSLFELFLSLAIIYNYFAVFCITYNKYSISVLLKQLSGVMNLMIFSLSLALLLLNPSYISLSILILGGFQLCVMVVEIFRIQRYKFQKRKGNIQSHGKGRRMQLRKPVELEENIVLQTKEGGNRLKDKLSDRSDDDLLEEGLHIE